MNRFAFIAHPITLKHLCEIFGGLHGKLLSFLPKDIIMKMLVKTPPIRFGSCRNVKSPLNITIEGDGIICPLLPEQLVALDEEFTLSVIAQAANKAKKSGAQIIALGGFTSVIGDEGSRLLKMVEGIPLTSGNTCTAALAIEGIIKAARILELELHKSTMAIIGATGDIGSICSKVFSKKVKKINIAARREQRLKDFGDKLKKYGQAEIQIFKYTSDALKNADIALTTTSSLTTFIDPHILKAGSIICDVSLPSNIPKEIVKLRKDVLVFEGGLAKLPFYREIKGKNWNRLLPSDRAYGCLVEAMLLTFENKFINYSIGRGNITEEKIQEMSALLKKHSFEVSDFFYGYRFFTKSDIENIKRHKM